MSPSVPPAPRRLADGDDACSRAIQQCERQSTASSEVRAWEALEGRLIARRKLARSARVALKIAAVATAIAVLWFGRASTVIRLQPEALPAAARDQPRSSEPSTRRATPREALRTVSDERSASRGQKGGQAVSRPVPTSSALPVKLQAHKPARSLEVVTNGNDCRALVRAGKASAADACYSTLAGQGVSLQSQIALYELARLRRRVLNDTSGAIRALRQYQGRFPTGSFRSEAQLALVELLAASGQSVEAEREAKTALLSEVAPERAGELNLLIASQRIADGDCVAALPRLEQAEISGADEARVGALRRRCDGVVDEKLTETRGAPAAPEPSAQRLGAPSSVHASSP